MSDVAAGTVGGLGMGPSGCYGDDRAYFEPVHGSAPDIVGRNIINPTATLLLAVMMLDYLGLGDAVAARERPDLSIWNYLIGGGRTETTLARNRLALESLALRPRVLRNVQGVDCGPACSASISGCPCPRGIGGKLRSGRVERARPGRVQGGVPVICGGLAETGMEDVPPRRAGPGSTRPM